MKKQLATRLLRANALFAAVMFAQCAAAAPLDVSTETWLSDTEIDGMHASIGTSFPEATDYKEYHLVWAKGDKVFNVNGPVSISAKYDVPESYTTDIGMTTVFTTELGATLNFKDDVDVVLHHTGKPFTRGGANVFYAVAGGTVDATEGNVRAFSIGTKPDVISAKDNGTVRIGAEGKTTQLVGSVDFVGFGRTLKERFGQGSKVDLVLDGKDSFWAGDLQNGDNMTVSATGSATATIKRGWLTIPYTIEVNVDETTADKFGDDAFEAVKTSVDADPLIDLGLGFVGVTKDQLMQLVREQIDLQVDPDGGNYGDFNLTVSNGATYTYMGIADGYDKTPVTQTATIKGVPVKVTLTPTIKMVPKRITNLTLLSGGRVNLFEEEVQKAWKESGLLEMNPELANVQHDYIRIVNLKGNDGIFMLDLNSDDKSKSDMVFVANSDGGKFHLEPYNLENLGSVSEQNRLRFATVQGGMTFEDKLNLKGEALHDYSLEIGHSPYAADDPENAEYFDRVRADDPLFDESVYEGAENWYITRFNTVEKPGAESLFDGARTGYLYGYEMDTLHKREGESLFSEDKREGLYVRTNYKQERFGTDGKLKQGRVTLGFQHKREGSPWHTGAFLDLSTGSGHFRDGGDSALHGYRLGVYHSYQNDGFYTDAVFSYGRNHVKLDAMDDFRAHYRQSIYKFGVELGKSFVNDKGYFIRPEAQLQWTRFGSGDSDKNGLHFTARHMDSFLGRIGLHAGKQWERSLVTAKAEMLHEFKGRGELYMDKKGDSLYDSYSMKGTFYRAGLSGKVLLGERDHIGLEVERDFGGSYHKAFLVNAHYRHSF